MLHELTSVLYLIRWQDVLDILIVSFLIYRILIFVKGTRTAQILVGIFFIFIIYQISSLMGLLTLNWLLSNFLSSIIIIIVIIFQHDIRVALSNFGKGFFWRGDIQFTTTEVIDEVARACITLSFKRIGALIIFPRIMGLKNLIEFGQEIDAIVSKELLESIFNTKSPLHDGAVIIRNNRITHAGCFLPLSTNPEISKQLGTRHRAAIGITEETDVVSLIVSEETGNISVGIHGRLTRNLDADTLRKVLTNLLIGSKDIKKK
jgi:diadenylate cyclase